MRDFGKIYLLVIMLATMLAGNAMAQMSFASESQKISFYQRHCKMNVKFHTKSHYAVTCGQFYHHYNARSSQTYYRNSRSTVRIAEWNLLHPGAMNTQHKDYQIIAKIINKWDVVGAVELLSFVSEDLLANERIVKFLTKYKSTMTKRKSELSAEKKKARPNKQRIAELEKIIKAINDTYKYSDNLFRTPGYLKLLNELRKLDPSWSLLLSPNGEAAKAEHTQELLGFFYRGRSVRPVINEYCKETNGKKEAAAIACFPHFDGRFLGKNVRHVFSRRPFMASFQSGNFDFTLLVAHVIYTSPEPTSQLGKAITKSAFGVSDYRQIGMGVSKKTYARWAETKVTLDFIEKYKARYREKDLIYMADFNLSTKNQFWNNLLAEYRNQTLHVASKTTISKRLQTSNGNPTDGLANDFDHMILDYYRSTECRGKSGRFSVRALPFYSGTVGKDIGARYIVRSSSYSGGKFPITKKSQYKSLMDWKSQYLNNYYITIASNLTMVRDINNYNSSMTHFQTRILDYQQYINTYFQVYTETLSDHLPIYMSCSTQNSDDD